MNTPAVLMLCVAFGVLLVMAMDYFIWLPSEARRKSNRLARAERAFWRRHRREILRAERAAVVLQDWKMAHWLSQQARAADRRFEQEKIGRFDHSPRQ